MATAIQFKDKSEFGKKAEFFVTQHLEESPGIRWLNGGAKEEGSDIASIGLDLLPYGVEVKGIRSFLTRDNTGLSPCGELPFEIMNASWTEGGFLFKWLHPDIWNLKHKEERPAVRPKRVHYVLYDNDKARQYPFCVITFNTSELFYYLKEAGKEWGWDIFQLSEWKKGRLKGICEMGKTPDGKQFIAQGTSGGEKTGFCWYVPLNKIISAAERVTMTGEQPPIEQHHIYEKYHPIPGGDVGFQSLQQARYDYLKKHSKGQEISREQIEAAEKMRGDFEKYAVLTLSKDLNFFIVNGK